MGKSSNRKKNRPEESRLVDSANQYHLWVFFDEKFTLNVGFKDGRFVNHIVLNDDASWLALFPR